MDDVGITVESFGAGREVHLELCQMVSNKEPNGSPKLPSLAIHGDSIGAYIIRHRAFAPFLATEEAQKDADRTAG
jgi:hypothetical protein